MSLFGLMGPPTLEGHLLFELAGLGASTGLGNIGPRGMAESSFVRGGPTRRALSGSDATDDSPDLSPAV